MEWQGWYCIAVVMGGFVVMAREMMGTDFAMMGVLVFLMAAGDTVVSIKKALEGFSNTGLLTVVILFMLAAGISQTGGLDYVFGYVLGKPSTTRAALARMVITVGFISAFINNTPLVAIMIPIVLAWCRRAGLAPGHLFIPLAYASILSGTITTIGTSTNLVVVGKQRETFPDDPPIRIFDLVPYGVPVALAGAIYLVIFAPILLPGEVKKRTHEGEGLEDAFLVGLRVLPSSPTIGKTLVQAGMRGLDGAYITSVKRGDSIIHAVGSDFIVNADDVLFFAGELGQVALLANQLDLQVIAHAFEEDLPVNMGSPDVQTVAVEMHMVPGADGKQMSLDTDDGVPAPLLANDRAQEPLSPKAATLQFSGARLMRARVRKTAPALLNTSVRDAHFRTEFRAAIISVRRKGQRLEGRFGDIVLQAGDELLFDMSQEFDPVGDSVRANLENLTPVSASADHEFMFAFRVTGASRNGQEETTRSSGVIGTVLDKARQGVANRTIQGAGLRGLPGVFLVAVERNGETIHAPSPDEMLRESDILWFAGSTEGVLLLRKLRGIKQLDDQTGKLHAHVLDRRLVHVVVGRSRDLVGKTVREIKFRTRFDAAIIALHREGARVRQRIGDIVLQTGDVLLLDTGSHFIETNQAGKNFALVAEVEDSNPPRYNRALIASALAVTAIGVNVAEVMDLLTVTCLAVGAMLLTGCLSGDAARRSVKWDVYLTIAAAFGISNALEHTRAAKAIADLLVNAGEAIGGDGAIQVALYITTAILSNIVANNAAAALMYPIAAEIAIARGLRRDLISYLLMFAASAGFAIPFGYQCNLMVYGVGGYKFRDFVKFGAPMELWQTVIACAVILLPDLWPLMWAITGSAAFVVMVGPNLWDAWHNRRARIRSKQAGHAHSV